MTYHGDEAFPALSDEQRARLQAYAGAILAAVLISSRGSREHAEAARNEGAAAGRWACHGLALAALMLAIAAASALVPAFAITGI